MQVICAKEKKIKITQRYMKVLKISEHAYGKIERMKLPKKICKNTI